MDLDDWENIDEDKILRMYSYHPRRPPISFNFGSITNYLVGICIIVFIASLALPEEVITIFLFRGSDWMLRPWSIITNAFFHAGLVHLGFNLLNVWMFGQILERKFGQKFILLLFFGSVITGNLAFGFLNPDFYGLGISGYVYGLIGASVLLMPNTIILSLFGALPISIAGPIMFIAELLLSFGGADGIGHAAHAAGFIIGLGLAYYVKHKKFNFYW